MIIARRSGSLVHVAGLASVVVALAAAGCSSDLTTSSATSSGDATSSTSSTSSSSGSGGGGGSATPAFRLALSVSPFSGTLVAGGAVFSDGTTTAKDVASLEAMLVAHGGNEVFARISTEKDPTTAPDDHSEATGLARAALAKSLGLPFNPELGLWSHYGDIGCEPGPDFSAYPSIQLPGPWSTLTVDQMIPALHDYGALVAKDIVATGAVVNFWDVGNEIDLGVAGVAPQGFNCAIPSPAPDGVDPAIGKQTVVALLQDAEPDRIAWLTAHVWPHEARLLAAARAGILSVVPDARFATHMSQSHSATFALAFYTAMSDGGFAPDQLGFSFYPSSNDAADRVAAFKDTVTAVHAKFGRPVFLAEVAYPAAPMTTGAYATWNHPLPSYPVGVEGQAAFLRDLASWGPSAGLSGVRPWAPEVFLPGWGGFALFDASSGPVATARKGLDALRDGVMHPDPAAFHD